MPINRILVREHELAVQAEATYGTDPGAVGAGDFFKASANPDAVRRVIARYRRNKDRDYQQASVITTLKGREHSEVTIVGDLIPSGNATTPTEPDVDELIKACMGTKRKATAHTTTAAGSSGVTLNLTTGGGAASGIAADDLIAIDVDATHGYEVRQVNSIAGDVVTMDRALSANPASGRTVKVGTTYKLLNTALLTVYLKRFLAGTTKRYAVPGLIIPDLEISIDNASETPIAGITFTGMGKAETTHSDARPTPTTAGTVLLPTDSRVWFDAGASPKKFCIAGNARLHINSGLELRMIESCSLQPSGVKRTGNESRYLVEMAVDLLATTGDEDTLAIYDAVQALTAQDVLVQIGKTAGQIAAWRCKKFIPDPQLTDRNGEFGINLGGGQCDGTNGDDEVFLGFI
jgi:hypothetical protein